MEMYARWQELSKTPETATKIVNLIWTDYAAAAVVGTKGVLGPGNIGFANETVPITVEPIVLRVKCRSGFAIPAFILAAMFLLVNVFAFLSWIWGYSNWSIVKKRLDQSSIGRISTTEMHSLGERRERVETQLTRFRLKWPTDQHFLLHLVLLTRTLARWFPKQR